jgi:hypothetical protein
MRQALFENQPPYQSKYERRVTVLTNCPNHYAAWHMNEDSDHETARTGASSIAKLRGGIFGVAHEDHQ